MEVVGEQIKRGRGNSWAHVRRIEGKVERGGETYRRVEKLKRGQKLTGGRDLQGDLQDWRDKRNLHE